MKYFVFTVTMMSALAMAEESKDFSKYETVDMKQFEKVKPIEGSKIKFAVGTSCTTPDGRNLTSNDPGFSECLQKAADKTRQEHK